MHICLYTIDYYDEVAALLYRTSGVSMREVDSKSGHARYLARNPGLSFLAIENGHVVGCVMGGHDGRRGYLHHVMVAADYRGRGIANALVERCLKALEELGILKTHIDVLIENEEANDYWERRGWQRRSDLHRYSMNRSGRDNE